MKIRLLIISAVLVIPGMALKAQSVTTNSTQVTTFGIRAGVNFQNITGKNSSGNNTDNKLKTGFNIGANAEIPVAPDFYVQPGVLLSTKGAKSGSDDSKINISYIEVPVNLLYKPVLGMGRMLLGFGPYIGFAAGGKYKPSSGNDVDISFKNTLTSADIQNGNYYYKRIDAGANFLAGYEFSNKLSFQLNAQLGLVKINPKFEGATNDKASLKNTGFGISAGYRF